MTRWQTIEQTQGLAPCAGLGVAATGRPSNLHDKRGRWRG